MTITDIPICLRDAIHATGWNWALLSFVVRAVWGKSVKIHLARLRKGSCTQQCLGCGVGVTNREQLCFPCGYWTGRQCHFRHRNKGVYCFLKTFQVALANPPSPHQPEKPSWYPTKCSFDIERIDFPTAVSTQVWGTQVWAAKQPSHLSLVRTRGRAVMPDMPGGRRHPAHPSEQSRRPTRWCHGRSLDTDRSIISVEQVEQSSWEWRWVATATRWPYRSICGQSWELNGCNDTSSRPWTKMGGPTSGFLPLAIASLWGWRSSEGIPVEGRPQDPGRCRPRPPVPGHPADSGCKRAEAPSHSHYPTRSRAMRHTPEGPSLKAEGHQEGAQPEIRWIPLSALCLDDLLWHALHSPLPGSGWWGLGARRTWKCRPTETSSKMRHQSPALKPGCGADDAAKEETPPGQPSCCCIATSTMVD